MRILTFDIEDWFHILDLPAVADPKLWDDFSPRIYENTKRLLDLLNSTDTQATFFVLGWVAHKYPSLVREITDAGFEVGSHSYHHQLVYTQSPNEFSTDLRMSLDAISQVTQRATTMYRAPGFSITRSCTWAFEILAENGIEIDCSVFTAPRKHGGIRGVFPESPFIVQKGSFRLKELPMTGPNILGRNIVFTGGGYFRLFPRLLISECLKRQDYSMSYFHPRDFDPKQPRLTMGPIRRWQTYVGLRSSYQKLDAILREYRFSDVKAAVDGFDWSSATIQKF